MRAHLYQVLIIVLEFTRVFQMNLATMNYCELCGLIMYHQSTSLKCMGSYYVSLDHMTLSLEDIDMDKVHTRTGVSYSSKVLNRTIPAKPVTLRS